MRLMFGRTRTKRALQRGVAAVEFALLLPFITILVLATIDYGYYFHIAVNATEAARTAAVQASATAAAMNAGAGVTLCTDPAIATVTGPAAAPALAAKAYMATTVNATLGTETTATIGCTMVSGSPAYSIVVQVLFPPPSGSIHFGLPRTGANLRYTTPTLWRR